MADVTILRGEEEIKAALEKLKDAPTDLRSKILEETFTLEQRLHAELSYAVFKAWEAGWRLGGSYSGKSVGEMVDLQVAYLMANSLKHLKG